MVATRSGTRVGSPAKNATDEATETPAPTVRITRRRTVQVATRSQSEQTSDSQQDEAEEQNTAPAEAASSSKRESRPSECRPTDKQPESTHEADVSEFESCCSVASDTQPASRSKRRASVRAKAAAVDKQETSKTESSPSSLSKTPCRSTRVQKKPVTALESTTSQEDGPSEAESCSSVASLSIRVTRSRRKPAGAPEDTPHSEADSCSSAVSGPRGSTVRRSTRGRMKVTEPIPIHLEQSETAEASAALEPRRTRVQRGKARSTEEDQAYDSEGCQSGPSLTPRRTTRSRVGDSDSESILTAYTSLDSPCSTRDRETPCSSRTGSASSSLAVRVSRQRNVSVKLDTPNTPAVGFKSVEDKRENEPEEHQAKTAEDIPCLSVSSTNSDIEMEDDANNKTVVAADQERSVAEDNNCDLTLTLDETEAEVVKPESRQDLSSETEKAVEGCQDMRIADEAMETHKASSVQEIQAMEEESSSISVITQKSVTGTQEDWLKREENLKVLGKPEKEVDAVKEVTDMESDKSTVMIDQGPSEEGVMENTTNKEGPLTSSEASQASTKKTMPVKGCISLLDSSEDEESDDDGLPVDGGNNKAEDSDSDAEMCCSDDQPGPSGALRGNGLFVIDARPGCQPSEKYYIDTTQNEDDDVQDCKAAEDDEDFVDEEGDDDEEEDEDARVLFTTRKPAQSELSSSIDPGLKVKALGGLYINFDGSKSKSVSYNLKKLKDQKNQDELMKKSVIDADFEKKDTVPPYKESKHAAKLKRREERAKTTGDGWFDMRAPEITEELKNDLKALQMRSAMDPKRFYKKNDREGLPKYFQVGTVVDNPIDFYHSRIPKKERKRTIMEELLADAEFRSFNKKKYREIMAEKTAAAAGKMNKKKHKFHKKK